MAVAARALAAGGPLDERSGNYDAKCCDLGQDLTPALLSLHRFKHPSSVDLMSILFKSMEPALPERERNVVRAASRFCDHQGLDAPICEEIIEAFVQQGLCGLAPWSKATYRSVLRRLSGTRGSVSAARFVPSLARPPYSAEQRAELVSIALSQPRAMWRDSAVALLALGIGAGLRPGELVAVKRDDVSLKGAAVSIRVGEGRVVPVIGTWARLLADLASRAGHGHLFWPTGADRSYKNFVNDFCYGIVADPAAMKMSSLRARSSYICDHLAVGTPLGRLKYLSGIEQVESLLRYVCYVPGAPETKAHLRRALQRP
jgi:integrase